MKQKVAIDLTTVS